MDGYGVASGQTTHSPYPKGTIELQTPYFLELGLDISKYYPGTLNLSVSPYHLQLHNPQWTFPQVEWFSGCRETFSFSNCRLVLEAFTVDALIYYPHPETKPTHFQDPTIVEVLAPYLKAVKGKAPLYLQLNTQEVAVQVAE